MSLLAGTPGRRFSARYRHRRRRGSRLARALSIGAGGALMAIGALLFFTPGPGVLVFLAGGTLVARESPRAARALDRLELSVRLWLRIPRAR